MKSLRLLVALVLPQAFIAGVPVDVASKPAGPWKTQATRTLDDLPADVSAASDAAPDAYGGRRERGGKATGFFHAEQHNGRWWLIDPDGGRFIHKAVVSVAPLRTAGAQAVWKEKFGSDEAWATQTGFGGDAAATFFAINGLNDPGSVDKIRGRADYYRTLVPDVPAHYRRMMDGDVLRIGAHRWRCISGHGHAPEHISLYCEELAILIGGDMMLPRISTNVSVYEQEPEGDPLKLFLDSIDRFRALDARTLTLPAHGKPFTGLHKRIEQLHQHHHDRLAEVMQACQGEPRSAADMIPVLFTRTLDLHQTTFAMGESIAHLHLLWFDGRLRRTRDEAGVYRFQACA